MGTMIKLDEEVILPNINKKRKEGNNFGIKQ